jgi:hypothetical protein
LIDAVKLGSREMDQDNLKYKRRQPRRKKVFSAFGLLVGSIDEAYAKYGVTPIWLGCDVAGNGSSYWEGYNQAIAAEMKRRYIEVPKVFLTGSF